MYQASGYAAGGSGGGFWQDIGSNVIGNTNSNGIQVLASNYFLGLDNGDAALGYADGAGNNTQVRADATNGSIEVNIPNKSARVYVEGSYAQMQASDGVTGENTRALVSTIGISLDSDDGAGNVVNVDSNALFALRVTLNGVEVFGLVRDGSIQTNQVITGAVTPMPVTYTKYLVLTEYPGLGTVKIPCI